MGQMGKIHIPWNNTPSWDQDGAGHPQPKNTLRRTELRAGIRAKSTLLDCKRYRNGVPWYKYVALYIGQKSGTRQLY
ncbi:hypothetical protein ACRALDRAFT_1062535 [Sodiomyces alcalophilus JCM 7366]|uniref:uncharacterized protein n=1 Tax=Sodiomyces alcalophilus JCM 7366 TaxID=591952 RepID=UPI0039B42A97